MLYLNKEEMKKLKEWVKDLRSGEFKQTRYALQNREGFCCLGVLCNRNEKHERDYIGYLVGGMALEMYGANEFDVSINKRFAAINIIGYGVSLSDLNDEYGLSFDEIADLLELTFTHKVMA